MRRPPGLYEELLTRRLESALEEVRARGWRDAIAAVDAAEAPAVLSRFVHDLLQPLLGSFTGDDKLAHQVELVNAVVDVLRRRVADSPVLEDDAVAPPARQLLALVDPSRHGVGEAAAPERPSIPLAASALLVNGPRDHTVSSEVQLELASADRVDLLVSFLKWSGLRLLRDRLRRFLDRRPGALRVLTTTYMGATDRRVLDELVRMGAAVKVSYDTRRTRLHAKAWLFHRDSGYDTALIGSSNLSAAALVDGLEWNVRLSRVDAPQILERFASVFEHYWEEGEFEGYDPVRDGERFERALRAEQRTASDSLALHFDIRPHAFQQEILDQLDAERRRGHTRNLVVAATGTGKTVVAALDYRRLCAEHGRLRLLMVAHRREILDQSLGTFRVVLRDTGFGERLYAGHLPAAGQHVFASIQSLHDERLEDLDPRFYDMVIVDEFHHAAAPTYDRLLRHVRPRFLLGLTATPERADGEPITGWFDHRIASELRLWHALDQQLLCPFQYFAVADGTDLRGVGWHRGRYVDSQLERLYTGDSARAAKVLRAVHDTVEDAHAMRALGFCVSIAHAEFMAREFERAGIPATALTANSGEDERSSALRRLRQCEINIVFTVDLFNEGVDVPEVDTVLFLRPTESATVFLQQLGRGLRLAPNKECLTALDFVGQMHRRFRFDRRFRAIIGGTRRRIQREVEQGFPTLPPGCAIHLEREAQQLILANIRETLGAGWSALVEDLQSIPGPVTLGRFLREADVDLGELYAGGDRGWSKLCRAAGRPIQPAGPNESRYARAISRLVHVNDPLRAAAWRSLLANGTVPSALDLGRADHRLLLMLASALDSERRPLSEQSGVLRAFLSHEALRDELGQLLGVLEDAARRPTAPHQLPIPAPLYVHADYQLTEIMAAFGAIAASGKLERPQAGVRWLEGARCDLLFVTLEKSEKDYSPTTMYNDYPISQTLFHWQSQSGTREMSATGQRYIHHEERGSHVLLFVRRRRLDDRGETAPYTFLGTTTYVSHRGERPMSMRWHLGTPMPAALFEEMKVAAG